MDYKEWTGEQESVWADAMTESVAEVGPMPPWSTMILGATAGLRPTGPDSEPIEFPAGPDPEGTVIARIQAASQNDAEQIGRVVEHRWNTGTSITVSVPYAELMSIADVGTDGSIATIDFSPVQNVGAWSRMVMAQDVFPFIYGEVQT